MNRTFAIIVGLSLTLGLSTIGNASAYAPNSVRGQEFSQTTRVAALPPMGFQIFCVKNQHECAPSPVGKVAFSDELLGQLKSVNSSVNRSMRWKGEGSADVWTVGGRTGDCEDFALTKRSRLMKAGVPSGALRILKTRTRQGEMHAVLVVKTSRGDLVLDNLSPAVKTLSQTGYPVLSMSSPDPLKWS